jgi:hypothetical protein
MPFFLGFWDFSPKFKGFWDFVQLIFRNILPYFFSPNFFRHIIRRIIFKMKFENVFTPIHDLKCLNLMRFLNIAIILLGFFQVFYAIFRDFLGFWDLVRFWDFSKDFFLFLLKFTKIFRVIYPSYGTGLEFPWNQSTALALQIAVERNSCLRQFWQFSSHFETKIVIYAWFDQHLNSSIKVVIHSE